MTFTKTSQKFGQWADSRANTVYGLGFASEQHLTQVGPGREGVGLGPGWAWDLDEPGALATLLLSATWVSVTPTPHRLLPTSIWPEPVRGGTRLLILVLQQAEAGGSRPLWAA